VALEIVEQVLSFLRTGETRDRLLRVCTALTEAMLMASGAVACGSGSSRSSRPGRARGAAQWRTRRIEMDVWIRLAGSPAAPAQG
jgi:hypothetical protein